MNPQRVEPIRPVHGPVTQQKRPPGHGSSRPSQTHGDVTASTPRTGPSRAKGLNVPHPQPLPAHHITDRLHDIDSAADYLRCGRRLIYRLVAERKIRHTKAGRSLRFWQSDLDAYLDARAVEPLTTPSLRG